MATRKMKANKRIALVAHDHKKDDLIDLDGKKIIVKDKRGLARLSDFYA